MRMKFEVFLAFHQECLELVNGQQIHSIRPIVSYEYNDLISPLLDLNELRFHLFFTFPGAEVDFLFQNRDDFYPNKIQISFDLQQFHHHYEVGQACQMIFKTIYPYIGSGEED